MPVKHEEQLQLMVASYLRLKYPHVLFHSDFGSGIKLTIGQAGRQKMLQGGKGWPDMIIAEPRLGYHGLFLELKREDATVYLKNGQLSSNPHIREQAALLDQLRQRGYMAEFCVGFDQTQRVIDEYLS